MSDEPDVSDDTRAEGTEQDLADRFLSGRVGAADLPAGLAGVAQLLEEVRAAPFTVDPAREQRIVTAMAAAAPAPSRLRRRAVLVGAALAGFSLTGGLAAAGALPGPAQDAASAVLDRVGVSVPDGDGHRGKAAKAEAKQRAEERKTAGGAGNGNGAGDDGPPDGSTNRGSNVSGVARDTEPGPGHGGTVCIEASDDRCDNRGSGNGDDRDDDSSGPGPRSSPTTPPTSGSDDDGDDDRSGRRGGESSVEDESSDDDESPDGSGGHDDDEPAGAGS